MASSLIKEKPHQHLECDGVLCAVIRPTNQALLLRTSGTQPVRRYLTHNQMYECRIGVLKIGTYKSPFNWIKFDLVKSSAKKNPLFKGGLKSRTP